MSKKFLLTLVILLAVSLALFLQECFYPPGPNKNISFVQRVIDGDTIVLADGTRARLIGIDAPEKGAQCFEEATAFLHQLVSGKAVEFLLDKEEKDKYGRTLAYIFVDGNFVNLTMVEEGYAVAFPFEPNLLHAQEIAAAEQDAREQYKGCLWGRAEAG